MVSKKSVEQQLKKIKFNHHSWGRAEAMELPHILLDDEIIYECVNGMYEGGFALLCATNIRLLLIDKKPLNYLTVEDLRFDMINEIDYSHRIFGAHISISAGSKNLKFTSLNQPRLRKTINHVQHCMAESKKKQSEHEQDQNSHLEQINQQLQAYLIAQHQQQEQLRAQLRDQKSDDHNADEPDPIKPSPELSDYLMAQTLLREYRQAQADNTGNEITSNTPEASTQAAFTPEPITQFDSLQPTGPASHAEQADDLLKAAEAEIFGKQLQTAPALAAASPTPALATDAPVDDTASDQPFVAKLLINPHSFKGIEINPLRVAYAKLPMALRNRKFGRPSFHAHSQVTASPLPTQTPATSGQ